MLDLFDLISPLSIFTPPSTIKTVDDQVRNRQDVKIQEQTQDLVQIAGEKGIIDSLLMLCGHFLL